LPKKIDSPSSFYGKILQLLIQNTALLISVKGAHGGFEISKLEIDSLKIK